MSDIKWIRLDKEIFHNRKIRQIEQMPDGDSIIVIWLKILTLAGDINDGGLVYFTRDIPYTDELLATEFNRPLNTIRLAMHTFETFGMIEVVDDVIKVSNWERYQNVEGMERIREQTRQRVANYRERQKALPADVTLHNVTVTQQNREDKKREEENKKKRFTPPTVEEVAEYCRERHNLVDAEQFVDFYTAKGWQVGKNAMKDWRACVRTWEKRDGRREEDTDFEKLILKAITDAEADV